MENAVNSFREFLDFHGYIVTDSLLLRKLMMFLAYNIGNSVSTTSIGNTLVSEGLLENGSRKSKPATQTIQALTEFFIFCEIKRFDIKSKEYLKTLGKYYSADIDLRKIPDNYEKIVIVMECDLPQDQDGIKIVGAVDFLLGE